MDFIAIAQSLGVPFACLAGLSFFIWRVLIWIRPRADRLIDRHLAFLDSTSTNMDKLSTAIDGQTVGLKDITDTLVKQRSDDAVRLKEIADTLVQQRLADSIGVKDIADTLVRQRVDDAARLKEIADTLIHQRASDAARLKEIADALVLQRTADTAQLNEIAITTKKNFDLLEKIHGGLKG